jgi:hypothetical protein
MKKTTLSIEIAVALLVGVFIGGSALADDPAKSAAPPNDEHKAIDSGATQQGPDGPVPSKSPGTPTLRPKPTPKPVKPAANPPQ